MEKKEKEDKVSLRKLSLDPESVTRREGISTLQCPSYDSTFN